MGDKGLIPGALQMPMGVMLGFIDSNLNRMPEELLRSKLSALLEEMGTWLNGSGSE